MNERSVLRVAEVNALVKRLLDGEAALQNLAVAGELSNYKIYPSGHHYFTLKDADSALRCVMFKTSAARLRYRPENGLRVTALGRLTFERPRTDVFRCLKLAYDAAYTGGTPIEELTAGTYQNVILTVNAD